MESGGSRAGEGQASRPGRRPATGPTGPGGWERLVVGGDGGGDPLGRLRGGNGGEGCIKRGHTGSVERQRFRKALKDRGRNRSEREHTAANLERQQLRLPEAGGWRESAGWRPWRDPSEGRPWQ